MFSLCRRCCHVLMRWIYFVFFFFCFFFVYYVIFLLSVLLLLFFCTMYCVVHSRTLSIRNIKMMVKENTLNACMCSKLISHKAFTLSLGHRTQEIAQSTVRYKCNRLKKDVTLILYNSNEKWLTLSIMYSFVLLILFFSFKLFQYKL